MQKFDKNFDEWGLATWKFNMQNLDELIIGFIGKTLRQNCIAGKTLMSKFSTVKLLCYTVYVFATNGHEHFSLTIFYIWMFPKAVAKQNHFHTLITYSETMDPVIRKDIKGIICWWVWMVVTNWIDKKNNIHRFDIIIP